MAAQVSDAAGRVRRGIADHDKFLCVWLDLLHAPTADFYLGHDSSPPFDVTKPCDCEVSIPRFGEFPIAGAMLAENCTGSLAKCGQSILRDANLNERG
jgi:hypothetical protein